MSLIPEVKCRRCGESFSALRSRCPNCGTRVVSQSARTPATTPSTSNGTAAYDRSESNAKWQMIFGLILVVAVIIAVIVMVSTSMSSSDAPAAKNTPPVATEDPAATPVPPPTPTPTPVPDVQSVTISYMTIVYKDESTWPTMHVGDKLEFTATAYPVTIENPKFTWTCDDPETLQITPSDDTKTCTFEVLQSKAGGCQVTLECYGVTYSMRVYCIPAA